MFSNVPPEQFVQDDVAQIAAEAAQTIASAVDALREEAAVVSIVISPVKHLEEDLDPGNDRSYTIIVSTDTTCQCPDCNEKQVISPAVVNQSLNAALRSVRSELDG